eukprot:TRINITY_DN14519_c0_g1_i2.p1 TRINITY_DN14519_c0_g1~~TRINITY_DN14519_c0_g1_i2.p1  ORF type:complete len:609 (-),score=165.40 TRINITY_DN14519_c0_g1_i2:42-1868(-)
MFSWFTKPKGPDFGNPEALTNEERVSRMLHNPKASRPASTSMPAYDHFVVVGPQPQTPLHMPGAGVPLEPAMLYQYPQDVPIPVPALAAFCFPKGVPWRKLDRRSQREGDLLNLLYNQERHLQHPEDQFVFILTTEDEQVLYGICVYKEEVINNKVIDKWDTAGERVSYMRLIEASTLDKDIILAPRCYCFTSRFPFFKLHFAVINNVLALEYSGNTSTSAPSSSSSSSSYSSTRTPNGKSSSGHTTFTSPVSSSSASTSSSSTSSSSEPRRSIAIPSTATKEDTRVRSNSVHTSAPSTQISSSYPPDSIAALEVADDDFYATHNTAEFILAHYRRVLVPPPGSTLSFRPTPELPAILFKRPSLQEEENVLVEYALPILFYELSRENFFTLLTCILLERKICFYCDNLRVLSSALLSWITLIRPFVYQSIIIPLLPSSLYTMLESPVPFLIGVTTLPPKGEIPPDVIIVDVKEDRVYCKEGLPRLAIPRHKELESKFRPLHIDLIRELSPDVRPIPYVTSPAVLQMVEGLAGVIQTHLTAIFADFHKHCIRDLTDSSSPITVFIKESFLAQTPKQDQPWLKEFFQTQTFFAFSDKKLRSSDEQGKPRT